MAHAWEHYLPTKIRFGRGALEKLGEAAWSLGATALVVGYQDHGPLEEDYAHAIRHLTLAGLTVHPHFAVTTEPRVEHVAAAVATLRQVGADLVVAVGGGSAIDLAKAAAWAAWYDGDWPALLTTGKPVPPEVRSLPLIAVPTTAGTGAEVSDVAVIGLADADGADIVKGALFGPALRPAVAVIDPDLTLGSPPEVTAACAADALGHAIEAAVSRRANPFSTLFAVEAVGLVHRHLRAALEHPSDVGAREGLAWAALLAGLAFSEAGVGLTHALAQALGSVLGLGHGRAVAAAMPAGLRHNLPECREAFARLGRACGRNAATDEELAAQFVEATCGLLRAAGLPDHVLLPASMEDAIERLIRSANSSARVPLLLNPRRVKPADLERLFREVVRPC